MTELETEAETLERLENALRRISDLAREPRSATAPGPQIDREALLHSLDMLINRLRNGLESPTAKPANDGVTE